MPIFEPVALFVRCLFQPKVFFIYLFVFAVLSFAKCKLSMYYLFIILPIIYLAKNGLKAKFKEI